MKANAPETYPMQFKDKIDEYLWREHQILGGCCSSIESLKYSVAREVAEKLTDAFIEKAYSWLRNHYRDYMHNPTGERLEAFFGGDMCNDFEEYMKGDKV